jgi:Holliday junction resolvasome RuvABC endonuclease subunit
MTILGVDGASAKLAFVSGTKDEWIVGKVKLPSPFGPDNCALAQDAVHEFLRGVTLSGDRLAVVEAPVVAGARNLQSTIKQALVVGAVLAAIQEWGFATHTVAISSWKKSVVGHGGSTKEAVAAWLREAHPVLGALCGRDQDLIDAACIYLYGATMGSIAD